MNENAAKVVGEGLLKGAFDVLSAMLGTSFEHTLESPEPLTEEKASAWLEEFSVTLQGKIENELGAVAVLFPAAVAARFAAMIQEQEVTGATDLSEQDRAMLGEIAEPALGGGVTNLMERFGRHVEQLEDVQIDDSGAGNAESLMGFIGPDAGAARFTFSDSDGESGAGVVLFSQSLEALVPEEQRAAAESGGAAAVASQAELSPEEMSDILSDFGGAGDDSGAASSGGAGAADHGNLDMVLDIGLIATARLGHVEMPIGEILNLGPGSIIEVGHQIDEPVDLLVNGKLIARGDVVVVDEKFGLRITEIVSARARIESLR